MKTEITTQAATCDDINDVASNVIPRTLWNRWIDTTPEFPEDSTIEQCRQIIQQWLDAVPTLEVVQVRRATWHSEVIVREVHADGTTDAEETLHIEHSTIDADRNTISDAADIDLAIQYHAECRGVFPS